MVRPWPRCRFLKVSARGRRLLKQIRHRSVTLRAAGRGPLPAALAGESPATESGEKMSEKTQTVFLDGKESVTIVCQECGRFKKFSVRQLSRHGGKTVPVKCACGAPFKVFLERRGWHRKPVNIEGFYTLPNPAAVKRPMVVVNLSLTGLKLDVQAFEMIEVGDVLKVEFPLDDTLIRANVTVRNINFPLVGAEFVDLEERARQLIGFRLMA